MPKVIAVILQAPTAFFELGVLVEVFGVDRALEGVPEFDFRLCAAQGEKTLMALPGTELTGALSLERASEADLIAVPSSPLDGAPSKEVLDLLKSAHQRGTRILAMCSGAFALAWAGLLDGRRAATHWRYAAALQKQFPQVEVDESVLYVQEDNLITSAGTAAGIDACLHLVRADHGSEVAARIARRMVVAPHREGGQKQFIERPLPQTDSGVAAVLQHVLNDLKSPQTVASMAASVSMSPRSFARHFLAQTGSTPAAWVASQRVFAARSLLEGSELSMEQVAEQTGFGSATLMRHHFQRALGISPYSYRRAFRCR